MKSSRPLLIPSAGLLLAGALALATPAAAQTHTPVADLRFDKLTFEDHATVGDAVSFDLNVTNLGPGVATNVTIIDEHPEGFELLSGTPDCTPTSPTRVVCSFGDMGPGDVQARLLTFRATAPGTFTNTAEARSDTPDPDPTNNRDATTVTVAPPAPERTHCFALPDGNRVSWTPVDDATTYRVLRATGDEPLRFHTLVTDETFLDRDVVPEVTYRYAIVAVTPGGHSEPGPECEVTAIPFFGPAFAAPLAGLAGLAAVVALRRR